MNYKTRIMNKKINMYMFIYSDNMYIYTYLFILLYICNIDKHK